REGERLRDLRRPPLQHAFPRQAVEGVVDLHRRKPAPVKREHSVVFQVARIERSLPLLERVAARAGLEVHDTFCACSGFVAVRLTLSASMRSMSLPSPSVITSSVMSWPSTLRLIISSTLSRVVSLYFSGSNDSFAVC